jgi:hypothetical protein
MTSNSELGHGTTNDPFLVKEDQKVFEILNPTGRLLSKSEEIAGMIAYAQYSLQKHQYVEQYQHETGELPTEDKLRSIVMSFRNENSAALASLRSKSDMLLREYAREYLDNEYKEQIIEPIQRVIERQTSFWNSIASNLAGAILYTLLFGVILFSATASLPNTKFSKIMKIIMDVPSSQIQSSEGRSNYQSPSKTVD